MQAPHRERARDAEGYRARATRATRAIRDRRAMRDVMPATSGKGNVAPRGAGIDYPPRERNPQRARKLRKATPATACADVTDAHRLRPPRNFCTTSGDRA